MKIIFFDSGKFGLRLEPNVLPSVARISGWGTLWADLVDPDNQSSRL
jgi:hypothetical protein